MDTLTKWELFVAFATRKPISIRQTQFVSIESIEHEDGSGKCFNVTGYTSSGDKDTVLLEL
jgi:hypothetical protein